MKKINLLLLASLMFIGLSACGNEEVEEGVSVDENAFSVPEAVATAFGSQYASATDVAWEMEGMDYEVNFVLDGVESSAVMDSLGQILVVETDMAVSALLPAITTYLAEQYAGFEATTAEMVAETGKGTFFEVKITGDGTSMELIFDAEGLFVSQSVAETESEEGTEQDGEDAN
jgi:hypothetical protein